MSDELVAPFVTILVLVLLVLWVPALHLCDGCWLKFCRSRADRRAQPVAETSGISDPVQTA